MRDPAPGQGGLGLHLVDTLADHWGSSRDSTGKYVWTEHRYADPLAANPDAT